VTADDIDLSGMRVIVDSDGGDGEVLSVTESPPDFGDEASSMDLMALFSEPVEDNAEMEPDTDDMEDELLLF